MSDVFNNSIQTSSLGERLTTIKNLYVPPGSSQVLALGFGAEVEPLNISNYGKSLLNVSSLNGLVNLINQQDSKMEVLDSGIGEINVIVDNQLVAKWTSGNLTFQPNKILYVDTIMSASAIVNFFSDVKPVINSLNFGTSSERWNNIYSSTINTNTLTSTGAGDINCNVNLITNGLYIDGNILPYTGNIPIVPQDIGSVALPFQDIYSQDLHGTLHTNRIYNNNVATDYLDYNVARDGVTSYHFLRAEYGEVDTNTNNLFIGSTGSSGILFLGNTTAGVDLEYLRCSVGSGSFPYTVPFVDFIGNGATAGGLSTGHICPIATTTYNIGSANFRYDNIYTQNPPNHNSDRNLKTNIKTIDEFGLDFINKLNPVSYTWKDGGVREHWGFIAQELRDVLGHDKNLNNYGLYTYTPETEIEIKNDDGSVETKILPENFGVRYSELISPIVKSIQELSEKVDNLENNTQVQGDTIVMNSTPVQQSSSTSSSSNLKLQKQVDSLIGRVFTLENKTEEEESESDFSIVNNLQQRVHTLEMTLAKQDKIIKKLTTSLNKLIKNM